jgi:general secretion pathway protein E
MKAIAEGMMTLRESAIQKMLDGLTTYQEILRVTWENY